MSRGLATVKEKGPQERRQRIAERCTYTEYRLMNDLLAMSGTLSS